MTGIGILHVVGLYALSRFLVPDITASVERTVLDGLTVTVTTPPDPPVETPSEPDEGASGEAGEDAVPQPVTAPTTPIERQPEPRPRASSTGDATVSGARSDGDGTGADGEGLGTGSGNRGGGQGDGAVVKPSVRSGSLDPLRDFPVPQGGREARYGTSVTVVFTVTREGRARDCSVARTSADPETTALVCGLVIDKIRFNPARGRNGNPVDARYGYRVDFRRR